MKRQVAEVMLLLMLMSTLPLSLNIRPAKSEPTTIIVPDDYPTIQAAVDAANAGDTVFVRQGGYEERVGVNKPISLIGQDAAILMGLTVQSNNVTISNFWIDYYDIYHYALKLDNSNSCRITHVDATAHRSSAIQGVNSHFNTFDDVVGSDDDWGSVGFYMQTNGSIFRNCHGGFAVGGSNNRLENCHGPVFLNGDENTLSNSTIYDLGAFADHASFTLSGNHNEVYNNTIESVVSDSITGANNLFYHNDVRTEESLSVSGNNNLVYRNNFYGPVGASGSNIWDIGYPSGGNYYSNYDGFDSFSGPYQNETGSDGIGDTPYLIAPGNRDNYPFMKPYVEYDIALTNVVPSKTAVSRENALPINVSVENQGQLPATSNITLNVTRTYSTSVQAVELVASTTQGWNYSIPGPTITAFLGDTIELTLESADNAYHKFYVDYNGNAFPDSGEPTTPIFINTTITYTFKPNIGTYTYYCAYHQDTMYGQLVVNPLPPPETTQIGSKTVTLEKGEKRSVTFVWLTDNFSVGVYRISAYAEPVSGETDTLDNSFTDGWVYVTIVGDVTGSAGYPDGKVDIRDIYKVAQNYGTVEPPGIPPWDPAWGPICDINNDGKVDIRDYYIVCKHYGETEP